MRGIAATCGVCARAPFGGSAARQSVRSRRTTRAQYVGALRGVVTHRGVPRAAAKTTCGAVAPPLMTVPRCGSRRCAGHFDGRCAAHTGGATRPQRRAAIDAAVKVLLENKAAFKAETGEDEASKGMEKEIEREKKEKCKGKV